MPVPPGCVLVTIGEEERALLRDLAWKRRRPMYKVLGDLIVEAVAESDAAKHSDEGPKESLVP